MENERKKISEPFARQKVFHAMERRGRGKDQVISDFKLHLAAGRIFGKKMCRQT